MKIRKKLKHSLISKSLLFQYLISYMIVLIIPLVFFSAFVQYRFRSALIFEIQQNSEHTLSNCLIREEKNVEKIQDLKNKMLILNEFNPLSSPAEYEKANKLLSDLNGYATASGFPLMGVYWENSAYLYSNVGTCRTSSLPESIFTMQKGTPQNLRIYLSSLYPLIGSKENFVIYSMPISYGLHTTKGYVFFAQTVEQFLESISYSAASNEQLYLYTDEKNFIYGDMEILLSLLPDEIRIQNQGLDSLSSFFSKDGNYLLHQLYSPLTGLTFINATPISDVLATANRLQTEMFLCIVTILLLSSLLICLMIHFNYSPIQQLMRSVEHLFKPQQHRGNEIQAIEQAFRNLELQKKQLMLNTEEASQDYFIRRLLRGKVRIAKDESSVTAFQPTFSYSNFAVCSLLLECTEVSAEKAHTVLQDIFSSYCVCYLVEENQPFSFAAITNFDNNEQTYYENLDKIRSIAEEKLQCPVTLACGSIGHSMKDISQSYIESVYALDYCYVKGKNCTIFSEEVSSQDEFDTSYPYVELRKLKNQLKQRNIKAIDQQLGSILDYINTSGVPLFVARRISYDIVNMVLSSLKDEELKENQSYINSLTRFHSVQELGDAVYNIYHNLIAVPEQDSSSATDIISEMKSYIQDNFTSPDFSLQAMAEYFEMSMTGLSQYFKSRTGQTLIDYYSNLRIELAKNLLSEHTYKIDEVASMIGYNNTSSFIRRFKQLTGVSPGQYSSKND